MNTYIVLGVNVTKVEKRLRFDICCEAKYYYNKQSAAKPEREGSETISKESRKKFRSSSLPVMEEDIVQRREKMRKGIIYKAYNKINNKCYIGQTIQLLSERKGGHYSHDPELYFHRALRKYPPEDWEWTIIDEGFEGDDLNQKEIYWINYYDSRNPDKGYNIALGGSTNNQTQEMIRYARNRFLEDYGAIAVEKKRKLRNIKCVETGVIYKNAAEASRQTGIHHSHMVAVANGHQKTAGGFHWEWCIDLSLFPNAIYCVELDKIYLSFEEAHNLDHFSNVYLSRAFKAQGSPCIYAGYTFYKLNP